MSSFALGYLAGIGSFLALGLVRAVRKQRASSPRAIRAKTSPHKRKLTNSVQTIKENVVIVKKRVGQEG